MSKKQHRRNRLINMGYPSVCAYCGKRLIDSTTTIDHITPKSKGGTNHIGNLALSCAKCNRRKADKLLLPNYGIFSWEKE